MRIYCRSLTILCFVFLVIQASVARAQTFWTINVEEDATISGAAFFGKVYQGLVGGYESNIPRTGMTLSVTQGTEMVWGTVLVPGYYEEQWITVEDWGWSTPDGWYVPNYEWQIVSYEYFPPIYDEFGNMLNPDATVPHYDWVYVGDVWYTPDSIWGVIGTHQETQSLWVAESYQPVQVESYGAPVIHQKASRSDANWVWEVPNSGGAAKTILRLWDGGLALPRADGTVAMAATPASLIYSLGTTSTEMKPEVTTYLTQVNNNGVFEESKMEARPELTKWTRREISNGTATLAQTQIAAKSASFAGVVTVQGDLKVQGTFRVAAGGDIAMGEFTHLPAGVSQP